MVTFLHAEMIVYKVFAGGRIDFYTISTYGYVITM